jgi:hypothetical protein
MALAANDALIQGKVPTKVHEFATIPSAAGWRAPEDIRLEDTASPESIWRTYQRLQRTYEIAKDRILRGVLGGHRSELP